QRHGVGPETPVGVYVERSLEMIVALLGVLKSGGAYVPLDPDFPPDRLAFMLEDSRIHVLLTEGKLLRILPTLRFQTTGTGPAILNLCLDDWSGIASESNANLTSSVTPENLAYVIYTSGSTGKPKGVAITHRALTNFLSSVRQEPGLSANDTLLAVTTL